MRGWQGEALVSLRLGASPAEIELAVPQSVRVAVETLLTASSVSIVVNEKRVHRGFMEPGYKEAGQRLRVVIEGRRGLSQGKRQEAARVGDSRASPGHGN